MTICSLRNLKREIKWAALVSKKQVTTGPFSTPNFCLWCVKIRGGRRNGIAVLEKRGGEGGRETVRTGQDLLI